MSHQYTLQVKTSDRFMKAYSKAIFSLQGLIEGAVHDFVNRQRSNPKTVKHSYDQVAHINSPVVELDISGGHRLLAVYEENYLLLLDVGKHEVVSRYSNSKLKIDKIKNKPALKQFWPEYQSKIFSSDPDKSVPLNYPEEISSEWLYFLEEEQKQIFEIIVDEITSAGHQIHFIMGGPGTGKSCILLNLLKFFVDLDYKSGLIMSKNLAAYVEKSTGSNISHYFVDFYPRPTLDLLFVDDPRNLNSYVETMELAETKSLVIAFDPLQLSEDLTDSDLDELVTKYGILTHSLAGCYRQKKNVGLATKRVIDVVAASTPFLRKDKIKTFHDGRKSLTQQSNELIFLNPRGYTEYYPNATVLDVKAEVNRILNYDWLMWKHWPGLLILLDQGELSEETLAILSPLFQRNYVKKLSFFEIEDIKGLEFQRVFIFVEQQLFHELQYGFEGSGQNVYHRRRLLRIPFSRAKDSLVVFAQQFEI